MSSFDRRSLLISIAALAGCGFTPVHGPDGSADGLRGLIEIDDPRDDAGFSLVRQLEARLGLPQAPTYRLSAEIGISQEELGITTEQEITRFNLIGRVAFTLRELGSDRRVTSGVVSSFTSYSATGTPFATQTARADARNRLMVALADQIVARLLATATEWRQ
jgi:LPS-assembly lipoprotein